MGIASTYRRLLLSVYLPSICFSIATQATIILLPLYILERHGNSVGAIALASFVVGIRGLGMLLGDIPSGLLTARFGDKPLMLLGAIGVAATCFLFAVSTNAIFLVCITLLYGFANAAWLVARLSFISETCEPREKGRVIALMAGVERGGAVLGPVLGGLVASIFGYEAALISVGIVALVGTIPIHYASRNTRIAERPQGSHRHRLKSVIMGNWRIFASAGAGAVGLMMLRGTRHLVLPLYGHYLGLNAAQIGLIFSLTSILDMAMFYPAGLIMDGWGRKWSAVPGTLVLAVGMALLPLATGIWSLTLVASLMAISNGLSTGVLMAMGSDYSPPSNRGEFLGVWRLVCDTGYAGGPLLVSAFVGLIGLSLATLAVAALGFAGGVAMALFAPEPMGQRD